MESRHAVWVSHQQPDGRWNLVSTGVRGYVDEDGDFIIPFQDDITAEEVGRIITGSIRSSSGLIDDDDIDLEVGE